MNRFLVWENRMNQLKQIVKEFLILKLNVGGNFLEKKPTLLLALSGGGDSLALFYLLIESQKFLKVSLHIAHVDHGWREESLLQADALESLCLDVGAPFHRRRLNFASGPNLEERCRDARYQFFSELQEKWNFRAVLLAHHMDDQGETVLKRLCEGARIGALGGLRPEVKMGSLTLWRPLLSVRKEELSLFLKARKIEAVDDWTNRDTKYLRARIRGQIFPLFENRFGKNIGPNFHRFGLLFQEIGDYLKERVEQIEKRMVKGPFGSYLERPSEIPQLEMRYLLEEKARQCGAHLSHASCTTLLKLIERKAFKGRIDARHLTYVLNRGILFFIEREVPSPSWKGWKEKRGPSDWRDVWRGSIPLAPSGASSFGLGELSSILQKKIKKWYIKRHVPPFLHDKAPIFCSRGRIVGECLTGRLFKNL